MCKQVLLIQINWREFKGEQKKLMKGLYKLASREKSAEWGAYSLERKKN